MAYHALCPRCRHENPSENRFCGSCGASLEASSDIIACRENNLSVKGHVLPARLGPAGKAVAVGLAMLGAEVGLSWLLHRTRAEDRPLTLTTREPDTAVFERLLAQRLEEVFSQEWMGNHRSRTFAWQVIRSIVITGPTDRRS
jgi:zinc ribbon protein